MHNVSFVIPFVILYVHVFYTCIPPGVVEFTYKSDFGLFWPAIFKGNPRKVPKLIVQYVAHQDSKRSLSFECCYVA